MTATNLNRVYSGIPPAALASLAIHAGIAGDETELQRIHAAVPRKTYTCPDVAYQWRRDTIETQLLQWAVDYWKATSFMMVANAHVLLMKPDGDVLDFVAADASYQKWAGYRRILIAALQAMCAHAGLDEQRIRTWLMVPDEPGQPRELSPDERAVMEERLQQWRQALDG